MNQGTHLVQTPSQPLTQLPVRLQASPSLRGGTPRASRLDRLGIVREMLSTIDCATLAGQRYLMGKIVAFFDELAAHGYAGVGGRPRFMLAHLLDEMRQEGARQLPYATRFIQHARDVLTLLDDLA